MRRVAQPLHPRNARLDRAGVLVVGPNAAFLDHISAVLPSLGEARVAHATIETLLDGSYRDDTPKNRRWLVRGADEAQVAVLKGDARWAGIIHRAVWAHVGHPDEALVVPRGARRWRVPAYEVAEIVAELRSRGVRYEAARAMMAQRLAHSVMLQLEAAGDSPDDRVQDSIARSASVRAYVKALWPQLDAAGVVHRLLSDADFLHECADGDLDPHEEASAVWEKPPRTKGSAKWSPADLALLDEAAELTRRLADPDVVGEERLGHQRAHGRLGAAGVGEQDAPEVTQRGRRRTVGVTEHLVVTDGLTVRLVGEAARFAVVQCDRFGAGQGVQVRQCFASRLRRQSGAQ